MVSPECPGEKLVGIICQDKEYPNEKNSFLNSTHLTNSGVGIYCSIDRFVQFLLLEKF